MVVEPDAIAAIAAAVANSPRVAFDLEFAAADRLIPRLCLVQVAWLDPHPDPDAAARDIVAMIPEIRVVDAIASDPTPIIHALAVHPCVIAHAPRQDVALLQARFGVAVPGLIDTQLMAAFSGIGDQVGLATLANDLLAIRLDKDVQWTAWEQRPLTDRQLAYAAADVRYLHALHALLAVRLGSRLAWVQEETTALLTEAKAAGSVTPETAWQQVVGAFDPADRDAVIALAAWRLRVAMEFDKPLGHVLEDRALLDLARHRPRNPKAVRAVKGMSPVAKDRADALVDVIDSAPRTDAGARAPARGASQRAQRWGEALRTIAHVIADEAKIAPRLLATRGDAEAFARAFDEGGMSATAELPAQATWRREILGAVWEGWLTRRLALVADDNGIQLRAL